MAAKELEWATEEVVLKSKKPSREERKNLQIMKLFGKLEVLEFPLRTTTPNTRRSPGPINSPSRRPQSLAAK